jgi:hypothetical protein
MKYTNIHGLPEALVPKERDRGTADFTVTELLKPPYQTWLEGHCGELCVKDAMNEIWSVLGKAVHAHLERHAAPNEIVERRFTARVDVDNESYFVSGQPDLIRFTDYKKNQPEIVDYKVVSAWAVGRDHEDWHHQLDMYAWLLHEDFRVNGGSEAGVPFQPTGQIVMILRDWKKNEALRSSDYPRTPVVMKTIALATPWATLGKIRTRIAKHVKARKEMPAECSPQERWDRPSTYAVMRKDRKRALRVYPTMGEAVEAVMGQKELSVQTRPGARVRCEGYCAFSEVCPSWRAEKDRLFQVGKMAEAVDAKEDEG